MESETDPIVRANTHSFQDIDSLTEKDPLLRGSFGGSFSETESVSRENENDIQDDFHANEQMFFKTYLPGRHILTVLGLWHPYRSSTICTFYNNGASLLIWFITVSGIIAQCFLDSFTWGKLLNSFGTICNLCAPFIICRHYLWYGASEELLILATNGDACATRKVEKLVSFYTVIILFMWVLGFTFFFVHFMPFFSSTYHYVFYAFVFIYSLGWWASWLGVYSFICNIHKLQITQYILKVKEIYGYSSGSRDAEENCLRILLEDFTVLREGLRKTQIDFSKIISFCVAYHILDLVVFSIAYWKQSFRRYSILQYIGGVSFDVLSILFKLFPAAVVNLKLHEVVKITGEMCIPDVHLAQQFPRERYLLHQYIYKREADLGMRILGVKITSKLTVGIFVTLTSLGLAFLYYAVPFLATIEIT